MTVEMTSQQWKRLAHETARWMRDVGAVFDVERHHRSYITSGDWVEQFEATHGVDAADMGTCVQHAHEEHLWISFEAYKGWYLSERPIDAATVVTRLINYVTSLADTIGKYLEHQDASGHMEEILAGYPGRVRRIEIEGVAPLLGAAGRKIAGEIGDQLTAAAERFRALPEPDDEDEEDTEA
jgi:hypothetical protein